MRKLRIIVIWALLLALLLAACDGDDGDSDADSGPETAPTAETTGDESGAPDAEGGAATGFDPGGTGITLGGQPGAGGDSGLPGCSDPDDEECPAALQMALDGEATADGVTVNYPARYFNALAGDDAPEDVLIRIEPSENNRYAERAIFDIYFAESVATALETLEDPETVAWTTESLAGQIGVSKDAEQEPPVNTAIGAFEAPDGRAITVKLTTTGKYGWDLWSLVYRDMLETLAVAAPADAG